MKTKRDRASRASEKEREMDDPEMHCENLHSFCRSETGRGPNRRCVICKSEAHDGAKSSCKRCITSDAIRFVGKTYAAGVAGAAAIDGLTMDTVASKYRSAPAEAAGNATPSTFTPDTIIAIATAFERMSDSELLAIAEECFRRCGPPRDFAGCPILMDMDSHEATMYYVVIPQLIARLARKI